MDIGNVALATIMIVYVALMFFIAFRSQKKIHNDEDFIVAGRRLPFSLATATLLATWFGAGTLVSATDEIASEGLHVTGLEPFGAGICLILAGLFFAKRLWNEKILTISDLFAKRYGRAAEIVSVGYLVSFVAWIAVQLAAMAGILQVFFDIDPRYGILLVASIAMTYTLIGGMWSVTVTDAVQVGLLIIGIVVLGVNVLIELGDGSFFAGAQHLREHVPEERLVLVPTEKLESFFGWLTLFIAGTVGILPGQDLLQRIFSSKSARVASYACLAAGVLYVTLGLVPVVLGLAAPLLEGFDAKEAIVASLTQQLLSWPLQVLLVLTLLSVILSSVDSALLAPSSILAKNFLRHVVRERVSLLLLTRLSIIGVTSASVILALLGEDAYALLDFSYSVLLPQFAVMTFALYRKRTYPIAGLATLTVGLSMWVFEFVWYLTSDSYLEDELLVGWSTIVLVTSFVVYLLTDMLANVAHSRRGSADA